MSKSVLRAINILDCFLDKQELTLAEIVELTEMSKTTVFRLLTSLEEGSLIVKNKRTSHDMTYHLALKLLTYGKNLNERLKYNEVALPHMKKLNEEIDELVHLTVIENNQAVYIETFYSTKPLRLVVKVGAIAPLYTGSAPKILLASLEDDQLEEYLKTIKLEKITDTTIIDKNQLKKEVQKIRENGYSISYSEKFHGTIGFSYPIYDVNGETIAALGVSIPEKDYTDVRRELILSKLEAAAHKISTELGFIK